MNKGFVFSFESIVAIILFGLILISLPSQTETSFRELIIIQKSNDLLKVWSYEFNTSEFSSDAEFVFGKNVDILIDGQIILKSDFDGERISTSKKIINNHLEEINVEIIVYYN